jgi:hypothetical protein
MIVGGKMHRDTPQLIHSSWATSAPKSKDWSESL